MIITISGDIGSGKSTIAKRLCLALDYNYLSTGTIQRNIAIEMGMTTLELNHLSDKDPSIDEKIDNYTRQLASSQDSYVVDSRLAWHFIPSSYKVYLQCEHEIAVSRIAMDKDRIGEKKVSIEKLYDKILDRRKSEKNRFLRIYGIDYTDLTNYHLILNTSYKSIAQVEKEVLNHFKVWASNLI